MKLYRIDDAAERIGLPVKVLRSLQEEGRIRPKERIGDVSYFDQAELDRLIQDLHASIQRASWREMEVRMEAVERRLEALERSAEQSSQPVTPQIF